MNYDEIDYRLDFIFLLEQANEILSSFDVGLRQYATNQLNKVNQFGFWDSMGDAFFMVFKITSDVWNFVPVWCSPNARCCEGGAFQEDSSQRWDWCSIRPPGLVYWSWSLQICEVTQSSQVSRWKVYALAFLSTIFSKYTACSFVSLLSVVEVINQSRRWFQDWCWRMVAGSLCGRCVCSWRLCRFSWTDREASSSSSSSG